MTILAFDPDQRTNAERVVDLAALGYLPEPVLDPTYGKGGMWKRHRPAQLIASDLKPGLGVPTFDFRALPWPDGTFGSVLFDPPYRLAGRVTNQGGMDDRYGIDRYRGVQETLELIVAGAREAVRVVRRRGYVIVKCQAQVCGGKVRHQPFDVARAVGTTWEVEPATIARPSRWHAAELVDELHLPSHRRQPDRKCKACGGTGLAPELADEPTCWACTGEACWRCGPLPRPPCECDVIDRHGDQRCQDETPCATCAGTGRVPMVQQHAARNYSTFLVFQRQA